MESKNIEFKSNLPERQAGWRDEYLKAVCTFANADGRKLIIGMKDVIDDSRIVYV